jgi:hypothetical protein
MPYSMVINAIISQSIEVITFFICNPDGSSMIHHSRVKLYTSGGLQRQLLRMFTIRKIKFFTGEGSNIMWRGHE